jgi:hypothetical protein
MERDEDKKEMDDAAANAIGAPTTHTHLHVEAQERPAVRLIQAQELLFELRRAGLAEAVWGLAKRS